MIEITRFGNGPGTPPSVIFRRQDVDRSRRQPVTQKISELKNRETDDRRSLAPRS